MPVAVRERFTLRVDKKIMEAFRKWSAKTGHSVNYLITREMRRAILRQLRK